MAPPVRFRNSPHPEPRWFSNRATTSLARTASFTQREARARNQSSFSGVLLLTTGEDLLTPVDIDLQTSTPDS